MVLRDYIEYYVSTCMIDCDESFKRSNRIKDTVAATKSILNYLFIREYTYLQLMPVKTIYCDQISYSKQEIELSIVYFNYAPFKSHKFINSLSSLISYSKIEMS